MHNKTKLLIFASLLLAACSTDPMQEIPNRGDSAPEIETSDKICNTSDDAVAGSLIVKFGHSQSRTECLECGQDPFGADPFGHRIRR